MNFRFFIGVAACVTVTGFVSAQSVDALSPTIANGARRAEGEAAQRATRSEMRLRAEGVRVNASLPLIEQSRAVVLRSPEEVAQRVVALSIVSERAKGKGDTYQLGQSLLDKYGVRRYLTPKERKFMADRSPSELDKIQMSWRIEAAIPLMWALNLLPALEPPSASAKLEVIKAIRALDVHGAKSLKLRSKSAVLDEADLIYRYHWAVVDARVNGKPIPIAVDAGIVQERHHALNWLIRYENQEWDQVTTDT